MYKWIFLLFLFLSQITFAQKLSILPKPQKVQFQTGQFDFKSPIQVICKTNNKALEILNEVLTTKKNISKKAANTIQLSLISQDKKVQQFCKKNGLAIDIIGEEGYHLIIQPNQIIIAANSDAGLLYGVYSLRQLVLGNSHQLPCVQITDFPAFKYRAVMDDISRGPLSNMTFLKEQIRRLAELKINIFTFYIEHVVKTKKHPNFAPEDAISISEFKALSEYAKAYNIKLIGSFQSLGHFRNILKAATYRHLGETDRMLKPAHTASLKFLTEVYDEMLPAFSSDFFNINADEAWDLVRGNLKPLADSLGADVLYSNHVNPLLKHLLQKNKKPMIWGDMLLSYPKALDYLPKETIILSWEYSAFESFKDWIDPIKERGFDFWVCPGIVNSLRIMPNYETTFINIQNFINEGYEKGAKGVMTTIWDDGGGHFFSKDWLGVVYAAEQSWHPRRRNKKDFENRFSKIFYTDTQNLLPQIIAALNQLKDLKSTQKLSTSFFEEQLVADIGQAHQLNTKDLPAINLLINQADSLLNILAQLPKSELNKNWTKDIEYWQFFVRHLKLHSKTYTQLIQLSKNYKSLQSKEEKTINSIFSKVEKLQKEWIALKSDYQKLWLQENRYHWLEDATAIFENKIRDLGSLKTLLQYVSILSDRNPLPAATDIRLDIKTKEKDFFSFWLVSPTFPINHEQSASNDFLTALGGELKARPTPYDWQKYQSVFSYKVDLARVCTIKENSVIYAYCRIESPSSQTSRFVLEGDEVLNVIVNGKQLDLKQQIKQIHLKKGKNHLILKLLCTPKKASFSFHLPDAKVKNWKQKYKITGFVE